LSYILFHGFLAHHKEGVYSNSLTKIPKPIVYNAGKKKVQKLNQQKSWLKNKILNYYFYLGHVSHRIEVSGKHSVHYNFEEHVYLSFVTL